MKLFNIISGHLLSGRMKLGKVKSLKGYARL